MNALNKISVQEVKGIGEQSAEFLIDIGIKSAMDLLEYYPFRYEDYHIQELSNVKHDERITVIGTVHSEPLLTFFARKKSRLTIRLLVEQRYLITCIFFNQTYLKKKLSPGMELTVTGKWDKNRQTITVNTFVIGELNKSGELEPVYHLKGKLSQKNIRKWIQNCIAQLLNQIEENIIPDSLVKMYKLCRKHDAIKWIHNPSNKEEIKQARRRLVYEEFFLFQLKMQAIKKFEREQITGIQINFTHDTIKRYLTSLPFTLTNGQMNALNEILADMKSPYRMNRLLQGDVGSGKTVVAGACLYAAVSCGYQGALMVPTEILAEQHFTSLKKLLEKLNVTTELLTSSIKGKKRKEILSRLQNGELNIVIGTHSLIQEEVAFLNLGVVVTDEQHRFGVEQRRILREKGENPNVLFMTATPIPRTLAITAFGDMDVSIINELPKGRKKIETYWAKESMLERVLTFVKKEIDIGRQAYFICPLIEESEALDVQNAIDVHMQLTEHYGASIKIGLMHGRLLPKEKDEIMRKFHSGEYQILVSTTVVEVGVNVPNATMMVIYDADRYGLSQLHQLRGRVGRGSEQSYCILIADPKTEVGKERMKIMTETSDGFELSERDLQIRGPGDFFGTKQSGVPTFKLGDVVHDYGALEAARKDAANLISKQEFWISNEYENLRIYLEDEGILKGDKLD